MFGCVALAIARLVYGVPLADRPALVLAVLLVVLGIQIIALGLIGELVIFASGRRIKEHVDRADRLAPRPLALTAPAA